jgi:hypothetical protein
MPVVRDTRYKRLRVSLRPGVPETKLCDQLEAEAALLREENNLLMKLCRDDEKVRIIEVLAEALKFYANPETYFALLVIPDHPAGEFFEDESDDHQHPQLGGPRYGKRARAGLREAFGEDYFTDPSDFSEGET